jgi:hypothetical protein
MSILWFEKVFVKQFFGILARESARQFASETAWSVTIYRARFSRPVLDRIFGPILRGDQAAGSDLIWKLGKLEIGDAH